MSFLTDDQLFQPHGFINGEFVAADNKSTFVVFNPATKQAIAEVARCGREETKRAIEHAKDAMFGWSRLTAKQRSEFLMAWHDQIIANKKDLAKLLSSEQGKPVAEAEGEIVYGASYIKWFAEEAKRIYGDIIPQSSSDSRLLCIKQPVGVVACITPWNFPNAMLTRKIAPALAAGCTVVCKPASETPLSALALGELANRAGIPKGVINILAGSTAEISSALTESSVVRKLTFTGSTPVGKLLTTECAKTLKRTSMELGGNAPFIVFETADLDAAVSGLIANKFRNAGQTCVCTNRVLVQSSVIESFTEKLITATNKLKLGDAFSADTDIGPLINESAVKKVRELVANAEQLGAQSVSAESNYPADSNFVAPIVIKNATTDMDIFSEEIFGPVAAIFEFENEAQAIEMANDSPFGLAAYFYSNDMSQVWRVGEALEAGMVGINDSAISNEMIPFGGVKESGQGREGSKYGLDDYMEIKHLKMGGLK
ncbi:NAD-dependent succinate-semialdehyde dehydrogenase [Paraglaciecola arctica]|uniref:Succinate-semialdehyde dehydrogenase n=1 Tax=Paraglaciecola arctica BSs20135 TaxID=493475 RepID=K6XE53_9ALTE|nr:NAD-dependent succinate-semialdehyde dehydrogenase [Paraglaciecola arctica]GAC18909.1 succinate-semialdehyde dehydrogenase [Paraglaciecola arctica BSs20135]